MADLAASNVTITINDRYIIGKKRYCECTVAFGNGSLYYPTAGVPMPTYEKWGMVRNIDTILIQEANAGGYVWEYDVSAHKLRALRSGAFTPVGDNAAEATHTHPVAVTAGTAGDAVTNNAGVLESSGGQDLVTGAGASHDHVFTGTEQVAAVLAEMANAAIAAQSLRVIAVGW